MIMELRYRKKMSASDKEKERECLVTQPLYLTKQLSMRKIHLETKKVHAKLLQFEKEYQVRDWTWQHQRVYYENYYNTKNSLIRENIKLLRILEETERKIVWCQYEAKLTPITRNGTIEDLQALYSDEVQEYERSLTICNANTILNQFKRYLDRY